MIITVKKLPVSTDVILKFKSLILNKFINIINIKILNIDKNDRR